MSFIRLFVFPLLAVLQLLLSLTMWVVIIQALISWVEPNPYNPIVRTLRFITDPMLRPFRRLQWKLFHRTIPVDLSPIFVILLIWALKVFLSQLRFVLLT